MKANTILFPTDFSTCASAAIEMATSLARDTGAKLLIVHAEEPAMSDGGWERYYGSTEPTSEQIRELLKSIRPADPNVDYEHRLLVIGEPADAIVELAENEDVDLIVMGTHGRSGFSRLLMGSVAEAVVRRAPCPVLTFKQPEKVAAKAT